MISNIRFPYDTRVIMMCIEKAMQNSRSSHKLDVEKARVMSSAHAFHKTPKIASKRDIYNKAARRNKVNLVSFKRIHRSNITHTG